MDFEHALHIFNSLYSPINGYKLSAIGKTEVKHNKKELTYGEVSPEAFYTILKSLPFKSNGVFYDLGSGTGKAVILAALLFNFSKCVGIELLEPLHNAAQDIQLRFEKEIQSLIHNYEEKKIEFICEDFLFYDFSDANIIFTHSTCFTEDLWVKLTEKFEQLKNDTLIITVTRTLISENLQLIKTREYGMAWGRATVHIYKKI
jgi:predicted RNA methylase